VANISSTNGAVIIYGHGNNTGNTRSGIGRTNARFNTNTPAFTVPAPINNYSLITQIVTPSGKSFSLDGSSNGGNTVPALINTSVSRITIGRSSANIFGSSDAMGNISEIVNFKRVLDNAEKEKVETYLAIKYGISLSHNYSDTGGNIVYTANGGTANLDYDAEIIGIAREINNGNLDQRIAKSSTSNSLITIANGAFTITSNSKNTYCIS
jgi:hypothetical protein